MIEYNKHERQHVRWKLNDVIALSNYTDSTEILDEVRRAEREKCAKVCDAKAAGARYVYQREELIELAAAIRAME